MIAPIFDKISDQHKNIVFAKIDIDDVPEAANFASIRSVPTFQFMDNSKKVHEVSGESECYLFLIYCSLSSLEPMNINLMKALRN
jgi:hypothetical protein